MEASSPDLGCPPADEIAAFIAGELQGEAVAEVERHLLGCSDCAQTVALLANTAEQPKAPSPTPPPPSSPRRQYGSFPGKTRPTTGLSFISSAISSKSNIQNPVSR